MKLAGPFSSAFGIPEDDRRAKDSRYIRQLEYNLAIVGNLEGIAKEKGMQGSMQLNGR